MKQEMNLKQWGVTPMSTLEMQEIDGGFLKGLGKAVKAVGHAIGEAATWLWNRAHGFVELRSDGGGSAGLSIPLD